MMFPEKYLTYMDLIKSSRNTGFIRYSQPATAP